ncbi:MAG TPA: BlaB/IND/MUS family subclass B1 metallo-beta-lactamase [Puia sp.]|nr:BlaB/IND/MUS family subclass B1 metallo-beta-lactamase [Puia sp.]
MQRLMRIMLLFYLTSGYGQTAKTKLNIAHLSGDFYVYTTFKNLNGFMFPSNSMYLVTDSGVILFDTPWDTTQCQPLLDSIKGRHNKSVIMCLATHFHDDRTAGLEYLRQQGVRTYSTKLTDELSRARGEKRAEYIIPNDTIFTIGGHTMQTYFPGQGHTIDNIVIWFAKERILYGGCLIKSAEAGDLGNIADANLNQWASTIGNLQRKFKNPRFIITGHQDWTSTKSLTHTLTLIKRARQKDSH